MLPRAAGGGAPERVARRVRIGELVPGDAPVLFGYRTDPEVARFQSWSPASADETRGFIVRNASRVNRQLACSTDPSYMLPDEPASNGKDTSLA